MRKEKLEEIHSIIEEFKTIEVIERKNSLSPHFINIDSLKVRLNNGNILNREVILKNKKPGSAVVMLPVTKEGDVILTIEPRVATQSGVGISFPAGYIEEGEEPKTAAKRELMEETGYDTNDNDIIELASFYQDSGCSSAYNHAFLMKDCQKISDQQLDESEYIKYVTCKYEEAFELMEMGYINDCNGIIALEKSKRYMKEM